ncbi:MAG: polysaccharide pyruvyl transferase family protein, partial [Alphaproteobacteria bacterium]
MTRICTINVRFSTNLGDGVIAECLDHAMRRLDPALSVEAVDLAGRRDYGDGLNRSRARILTVMGSLPAPMRRILIRALLGGLARVKLRPGWAERLRGSDAVVLGGGQLLADTDLNFPIKVASCLGLVAQAQLPVAVHGVGVGGPWSPTGRRLFRTAMARADIRSFIVRDGMSRQRAQEEFGQVLPCPVTTCPDPAVLVHEAYGIPVHRPGPARRIGLCVSHPGVLRLHGDAGRSAV